MYCVFAVRFWQHVYQYIHCNLTARVPLRFRLLPCRSQAFAECTTGTHLLEKTAPWVSLSTLVCQHVNVLIITFLCAYIPDPMSLPRLNCRCAGHSRCWCDEPRVADIPCDLGPWCPMRTCNACFMWHPPSSVTIHHSTRERRTFKRYKFKSQENTVLAQPLSMAPSTDDHSGDDQVSLVIPIVGETIGDMVARGARPEKRLAPMCRYGMKCEYRKTGGCWCRHEADEVKMV